jgi:uncharacterized protein with NRDE domain
MARLEAHNSKPYAGFNMLLLEPEKSPVTGTISYVGAFATNHGASGVITSRPLSSAECHCGGISNGIDGRDADSWPKVRVGIAALDAVVHREETIEVELIEGLFELLRSVYQCTTRAPHSRSSVQRFHHLSPECHNSHA